MDRNVKATEVEYEVSQGRATEHSVLVASDASLLGVVTAQGSSDGQSPPHATCPSLPQTAKCVMATSYGCCSGKQHYCAQVVPCLGLADGRRSDYRRPYEGLPGSTKGFVITFVTYEARDGARIHP